MSLVMLLPITLCLIFRRIVYTSFTDTPKFIYEKYGKRKINMFYHKTYIINISKNILSYYSYYI